MKTKNNIFYLLVIGIVTLSCSQNKTNGQQIEQNETIQIQRNFGEELYNKEFLKYANPNKLDSLKYELIHSFDIYNEEIFRLVHIDAEEVAEFNFDFFLPNLNNVLEKRNFKLKIEKSNDYQETHNVVINNEEVNLYTHYDLDNYLFWDTASRNFFIRVNELLEKHNIDENFFLLYGGNDLHAILLTSKQFEIISENYRNNPKEKPYLP